MRRGFPPSPDQLFYRRWLVGAGILLLIAFADIVYLFSPRFFGSSDGFNPTPFREGEVSETEQEPTERDSAFREVQRVVVQRLGPEYVQGVEWLDRRHEGHRGWYSYEGRLDVVDREGLEHSYEYAVTLELNPDNEWQVLSIIVE